MIIQQTLLTVSDIQVFVVFDRHHVDYSFCRIFADEWNAEFCGRDTEVDRIAIKANLQEESVQITVFFKKFLQELKAEYVKSGRDVRYVLNKLASIGDGTRDKLN
jgi:hypothetical protein